MPSVTRLLNRKSLKLTKTAPSQPQAPSPEASKTEQSTQPIQEVPTPSSTQAPSFNDDNAPTEQIVLPPHEAAPAPTSGAESSGGIEISLSTGENENFEIQSSAPAPAPLEISIGSATESPSPAVPSTSEAPALVAPVQASTRTPSAPIQPLIRWEKNQLVSGRDPLGKGIHFLFEKGATQALFLAITAPPSGKVPHFVATAAVNPGDKEALWAGLKWNPTVVPELWNYFVRAGFVELSPPGNLTSTASNRNVIRAAFGVHAPQWLLLVRVGAPSACRGVLALVANSSLALHLNQALPFFNATSPGAGSRAA